MFINKSFLESNRTDPQTTTLQTNNIIPLATGPSQLTRHSHGHTQAYISETKSKWTKAQNKCLLVFFFPNKQLHTTKNTYIYMNQSQHQDGYELYQKHSLFWCQYYI
jgi:hypothetical protein